MLINPVENVSKMQSIFRAFTLEYMWIYADNRPKYFGFGERGIYNR